MHRWNKGCRFSLSSGSEVAGRYRRCDGLIPTYAGALGGCLEDDRSTSQCWCRWHDRSGGVTSEELAQPGPLNVLSAVPAVRAALIH